jgi:hypothetical protein
MERWFSLPGSTDKTAVAPATVTMDFVLGSSEASSKYFELLDSSL